MPNAAKHIRVTFRGPTLAVIRHEPGEPASVRQILIPNAQLTLPGGTHRDGSSAVPHYAGLVVFRDEEIVFQMELNQKKVAVSDGSVVKCVAEDTVKLLPQLDEMAGGEVPAADLTVRPTDNAFWARVAGTVALMGGSFGCDARNAMGSYTSTTMSGRAAEPRRLATTAQWMSRSGRAYIDIQDVLTGELTHIALAEDQSALIYNWDSRNPKPKEVLLELRVEPRANARAKQGNSVIKEDHDFKWLYQLLLPPGDDWFKWLGNRSLPAPKEIGGIHILVPGTSDCFGACWNLFDPDTQVRPKAGRRRGK